MTTFAPADRSPRALAPMPWSMRLGRVRGVDVYVHFTTVLLVAWIVLARRPEGLDAVVGSVLTLFVVFAIVLLHELGHAAAARSVGVRTLDITLLPTGGVARMERACLTPKKELLVALAGPAVNLALAVVAWCAARVSPAPLRAVFEQIFLFDAWLAGFNLLPASPMDGGRALRAALAMRIGRARATEIAAGTGLALAVFLGGLALMFEPSWIVAALFVGIGASAEMSRAAIERRLAGSTARDAMTTRFAVVRAEATLDDAARVAKSADQPAFPVLTSAGTSSVCSVARISSAPRARTAPHRFRRRRARAAPSSTSTRASTSCGSRWTTRTSRGSSCTTASSSGCSPPQGSRHTSARWRRRTHERHELWNPTAHAKRSRRATSCA